MESCLASQVVGRFSCSWKQAYLPACRCSSGHCRSLFITVWKPQPLIPVPVTAAGPRGPSETFGDCPRGSVTRCQTPLTNPRGCCPPARSGGSSSWGVLDFCLLVAVLLCLSHALCFVSVCAVPRTGGVSTAPCPGQGVGHDPLSRGSVCLAVALFSISLN